MNLPSAGFGSLSDCYLCAALPDCSYCLIACQPGAIASFCPDACFALGAWEPLCGSDRCAVGVIGFFRHVDSLSVDTGDAGQTLGFDEFVDQDHRVVVLELDLLEDGLACRSSWPWQRVAAPGSGRNVRAAACWSMPPVGAQRLSLLGAEQEGEGQRQAGPDRRHAALEHPLDAAGEEVEEG